MKKFLKGSKSKGTLPAVAAAAQPQAAQGGAQAPEPAAYVVKEKDLSKLHKAAWAGDSIKLKQLTKKGDVNPSWQGEQVESFKYFRFLIYYLSRF